VVLQHRVDGLLGEAGVDGEVDEADGLVVQGKQWLSMHIRSEQVCRGSPERAGSA